MKCGWRLDVLHAQILAQITSLVIVITHPDEGLGVGWINPSILKQRVPGNKVKSFNQRSILFFFFLVGGFFLPSFWREDTRQVVQVTHKAIQPAPFRCMHTFIDWWLPWILCLPLSYSIDLFIPPCCWSEERHLGVLLEHGRRVFVNDILEFARYVANVPGIRLLWGRINVTARMSNISAFLLLDLTCFIIMSDNAAAAPAEVRAYSNERQKNQC